MIETITRCSICKRENCDGKEYIVKAHKSLYGLEVREMIVCSSDPCLMTTDNNELFYHMGAGHGEEYNVWDIIEKIKE